MKETMERLLEATKCGAAKWETTSSQLSFKVKFEDRLYKIYQDNKGETEMFVMNEKFDFVNINELKNTDILKKIYDEILFKNPEYEKQVGNYLMEIEDYESLKTEINITPELAEKYDDRVFFDLDDRFDRIDMVKFIKTPTGIDTLCIGCNFHWGYTEIFHDNYGKYLLEDTTCGSYIELIEEGRWLMKESTQEKFDEVNEIVNKIKERSKELKENFKNIQRRIGLYESWS